MLPLRVLWVWFLLAAAAAAQVVHVGNYGAEPWTGWVRTTVDVSPRHEAGAVGDVRYVLGRRIGRAVRCIDLQVALRPGEVRSVDLSAAAPWTFTRGPLPDPLQFGGLPTIGPAAMSAVAIEPDGAGWLSHWRGRLGRMLVADLWCHWYADVPGWCRGEVLITASNPTVGDMTATVPAGMRLRFGGAHVLVHGRGAEDPVCPAGMTFGDGQARAYPVVLVWPSLMRLADWQCAAAASRLAISAIGLQSVWPDGHHVLPPGASPLAWAIQHGAGAQARLHNWDAGPLGPTANHSQTGAQHDQVFVGGQLGRGAASLGCDQVYYLVGLGRAREPCHHREADGSWLQPSRHPRLVLWAGRAHPSADVSPDRLGKPRSITPEDANGWVAGDREHCFENCLYVAIRATGSPLLGSLMAARCRNVVLSETRDPRLSTSRKLEGEERAVGWLGYLVAQCDDVLEDRLLAAAGADAWTWRVRNVLVPAWSNMPAGLWEPRSDARILEHLVGYQLGVMLYQQAHGAGGLEYGCRHVGPPEGLALAISGARAAVHHGYTGGPGAWLSWDRCGIRDGVPAPSSTYGSGGAYRTGWFDATWFLPAVAVLLRHEPTERARSIWQQHAGAGGPWVPPGVR